MDDEYEIMMISATKRQETIVGWLAESPLAEPLKGASRSDFLVKEGRPVLLKDGITVELFSWLEHEGFEDRLMVKGYTVTTGLGRKGAGGVMIFMKNEVVKAPFKFDEPPAFNAESEEMETGLTLPKDDIPF